MHLGISSSLETHEERNDGKFILEVRGLLRLNEGGRSNMNKRLSSRLLSRKLKIKIY
jgi:hypothetical protein